MNALKRQLSNLKFKFLITLSAIALQAKSQNYNSSQYMNNLTPVNAAYSLLSENGSITTTLKKQWMNLPGSPSTFTFEAQLPIESIGGAVGITASDSQLAIEHLSELNAFFAKSIQLTDNYRLGVAMNAGIRKYAANYSNLDATDPLFASNINQGLPNVGFSIMLYSNRFYVGLSMPEYSLKSLGTASIDDSYYLNNHYNFTAAYLLELSQGIIFKPAALITYVKNAPVMSDFSGTFYFKQSFGMGLDLRSNNKMAGILSVAFDSFRMGYSYQFGVSANNLGGSNFSMQELSLTYNFGHTSRNNLL